MRKTEKIVLLFGLISFLVNPVFAMEEETGWKGNVEAAYLQTDGNTESVSLSAAAKAERTFLNSKLTGIAQGIYGQSGSDPKVTSDKSWLSSLKYDQNLTDRTYVYLSETVDRNTLKGIEIRYVHQAGIGRYFIKTKRDSVKGEIGVGYVNENRVDPIKKKGYANAKAFGEYIHTFTETTRFEQTVEYIPNLGDTDDYVINAVSAFITNLMGNFALKTSFAVNFDNVPVTGFKKSDRTFKTSLLFVF